MALDKALLKQRAELPRLEITTRGRQCQPGWAQVAPCGAMGPGGVVPEPRELAGSDGGEAVGLCAEPF